MRLIDADRLINGILSILKKNEWIHVSDMIKLVNNSRTAKNDNWIPVKERLPNSIDKYLVSLRENRGIAIQIFDGESFKAEVIAWKPRPEVYMKGK